MAENHGLTLLESELWEIIQVAAPLASAQPVADGPAGFSEVITWRPIEELKQVDAGSTYLLWCNGAVCTGKWNVVFQSWMSDFGTLVGPKYYANAPRAAIDEAIRAARKGA